ncbi:MAG: TasA family protein [Candidatus Bathyarchaeia archaeon]
MISKKIMASIIVIGILAVSIGWGTYSLFFDTETSSGNKFQAGTLDLKIWNGTAWVDTPNVPHFEISDVEEGDFGTFEFKLKNCGSLNGIAKMHIKNVVDDPGATPEPEPLPDKGELSESITMSIMVGSTVIVTDTLANLACREIVLGPFAAGAEIVVKIDWCIDTDVGNEIQGDIVTFDVEFLLQKPPKVVEGLPSVWYKGLAVRYKSFDSGGDKEVYLGIGDLGLVGPGARVEIDLTWQSNNKIEFTYDKVNDKLITKVDLGGDGSWDKTLEFINVASEVLSKLEKDVNELDFLRIQVATTATTGTATVSFKNVKVDGYNIGDFSVTAGTSRIIKEWSVTDFDFSAGFTITGEIVLEGNLKGGEHSKIEIMACFFP